MVCDGINRKRIMKCPRCGFENRRVTPSVVEKCKICEHIVYDRNYSGETLDWYSATKKRWYEDESGQRHAYEIGLRQVTNGGQFEKTKKVTLRDEQGIIEEFGDIPV